MPNSLTRKAGLKLGPIVLETLVKHYFDRIRKESVHGGKAVTQLRQDELLYDEAFNIVKKFLDAASYGSHTVEEVQAFSNTRTPSPPWVHSVRLLVPISCCDEAAAYLIKALGGDDIAKRIVGVVAVSVDAEWITARKDWREAKKRTKAYEKQKKSSTDPSPKGKSDTDLEGEEPSNGTDTYNEEMDEMRCILYAHGGGYYFGSIDQERYSIQRHARKINGRYPFPCAIQDLLAAYLFLIRPPPDASHRPVKPAHIVVAGDSAGGGLTLALLQVIRDTGLPMPAGGVLVSPCIHTNTATDVIPVYGLSMQKPSPLWPPPSDELTSRVHARLRSRIRQMVRLDLGGKDMGIDSQSDIASQWKAGSKFSLSEDREKSGPSDMPVDIGATASLPPADSTANQTIRLVTKSGETLTIDQQIHLYAQNGLIGHPLVSSALSYLGGLPPLLFIASDKEVLRDEIIYTAHKAANPSKFPLSNNARELCPTLVGIEGRYGPTSVHLQVYDDTAHVLPVLFSFTTPGKFCYRAIATFCKHVTGMTAGPQSPGGLNGMQFLNMTPSQVMQNNSQEASPGEKSSSKFLSRALSMSDLANRVQRGRNVRQNTVDSVMLPRPKSSLKRSMSRAASVFRGNPTRTSSPAFGASPLSTPALEVPPIDSSEPDGPRGRSVSSSGANEPQYAGEATVYHDADGVPSWKEGMIRERVSTRGVIRPLEAENELDAFHVPPDIIGVLSELAVRRYIEGKTKFDKKFAGAMNTIEKQRSRNLELAKKDIYRNMSQLQGSLTLPESKDDGKEKRKPGNKGIKEGLKAASGSWSWAWALDADERPPPSSIVSRRDTEEARRLARIADQAVLQEDSQLSANNLWSLVVNFLSVTPDKSKHSSRENAVPSSPVMEEQELVNNPLRSDSENAGGPSLKL
ncbi:hypothetical protein SERLADRAFT_414458 [Serpula lacrymans var. lacrymans S7.9]|uniref:Alpha/beta hydrolase fold-3 domain-containing protein n=1 Tax=Serpula lacrymans var. lacrymans (strain S7.9) TaxID=578457 RepID=F8NS92_SERL9|nr:uncharacterized protein SERLADRAFT_414458 [Serpula lacrymans var. lacrymans S7.9]EGO26401.1 hypothetical protein SERLADRAFT_414458 [Serpula lacrymans var. lacrymans S7.9]